MTISEKRQERKEKKRLSNNGIPLTKGEKVFGVINIIIIALASLICIYPLYYVFIASISSGAAVDAGKVLLKPVDVTFASFKEILGLKVFWTSYANTFFYTFVGTAFSMCVSIPAAFALANNNLFGKRFWNLVLSITLWFHAGFIPLYLNYSDLGAKNNRWMIIISFGIQAFNIILLRNYFESIFIELYESAKIDGASDFQILRKIYIPLSKPAIATVTLYYAMSRWNSYFWASCLLSDMNKIPLQVYIKQKIIDQSLVAEYMLSAGVSTGYSYTTLIYALVVCAVVPVLILFPFIQRYFTKGVMVGSVKG